MRAVRHTCESAVNRRGSRASLTFQTEMWWRVESGIINAACLVAWIPTAASIDRAARRRLPVLQLPLIALLHPQIGEVLVARGEHIVALKLTQNAFIRQDDGVVVHWHQFHIVQPIFLE